MKALALALERMDFKSDKANFPDSFVVLVGTALAVLQVFLFFVFVFSLYTNPIRTVSYAYIAYDELFHYI